MPKEKLRHLVYSSDVTTLLQDGLEKVVAGETTLEEVLKLIELDNDDPRESDYDLKEALNQTKISQEQESTPDIPTINKVEKKPEEKHDIEFEMPKFDEPKEEIKIEPEVKKDSVEKIEPKEEPKIEPKKEFDDEFEEDLMNMEF